MARLRVFPMAWLGASRVRYDYGRRDRSIHVYVTYVKPKREENYSLFRER